MPSLKYLFGGFLLGFILGGAAGAYGYAQITPERLVRLHVLFPGSVIKIADGDTLRVESWLGREYPVRLIGVDTPETKAPGKKVECYGPEATAATAKLAHSQTVHLALDEATGIFDKFDRVLAYVTLKDGRLLNKVLIEEGFAKEEAYRTRYRLRAEFEKAENVARAAHRGLWAACPLRKGS